MTALHTLKRFYCLVVLSFGWLETAVAHPLAIDILESYPFAYTDDGHTYQGTYWEYAQRLSDRSGIAIERRPVPKARVIANLRSGATDMAILFRAAKLEPYVQFVAKVRDIPIVLVSMRNLELQSYEDLYPLNSIGIYRAAAISPRFDKDTRLHTFSVSSYPKLVQMLELGRLDAIAGNGVVLHALVEKHCLGSKVRFHDLGFGHREQWLVMSNKSKRQALIPDLARAMATLQQSGELDLIHREHLASEARSCEQQSGLDQPR